MSSHTLSNLFIYPIKSLPGIPLEKSVVEERGLKYDRRWMLVDKQNKFITQRLYPQMVFIDVRIDHESLSLAHRLKSMPCLQISLNELPQNSENVQICWKSAHDTWIRQPRLQLTACVVDVVVCKYLT